MKLSNLLLCGGAILAFGLSACVKAKRKKWKRQVVETSEETSTPVGGRVVLKSAYPDKLYGAIRIYIHPIPPMRFLLARANARRCL